MHLGSMAPSFYHTLSLSLICKKKKNPRHECLVNSSLNLEWKPQKNLCEWSVFHTTTQEASDRGTAARHTCTYTVALPHALNLVSEIGKSSAQTGSGPEPWGQPSNQLVPFIIRPQDQAAPLPTGSGLIPQQRLPLLRQNGCDSQVFIVTDDHRPRSEGRPREPTTKWPGRWPLTPTGLKL